MASLIKRQIFPNFISCRSLSSIKTVQYDQECRANQRKGLVLGMYVDENDPSDVGVLTPTAERYNRKTCGRLKDLLRLFAVPKRGECRLFYNLESEYDAVVVCGLGRECLGYNAIEELDEGKEAVRIAAAVGCVELKRLKPLKIYVETLGNAESAAESAASCLFQYNEMKNPKFVPRIPALEMYSDGDCDWEGWQIGLNKAYAQNLARALQEAPSNHMTPTIFAQKAVEYLCKTNINVEVKVGAWAEHHKMFSFLAVGRGSCEPPIFLELSYGGGEASERPVVMIGKGVTFDSGGTCLLSPMDQEQMRGDLNGAAVVLAACRAIALMQLPINIRALIPLSEHMPGCMAMKPGDIVRGMNGKSIEIAETDKEGRLMLADALVYAQTFWPKFIVDVGSLTRNLAHGFGTIATPVFTNSEELWQTMRMAGVHTGERVWRLPLWNYYSSQVTSHRNVEVHNSGIGRGGDACKAAAFLREFVPCGEWMHLDTFNVLYSDGEEFPYICKGMSGRPSRLLVEFLAQLVCREDNCLSTS